MSNRHPLIRGCLLALLLIGVVVPAWSAETVTTQDKVIFHLDETANARWAMLLANAYRDENPKAKIVIIAYGPGVDFLLLGAEDGRGNPYDHAIHNLREKGVEFRVCAGTLSARKIDKTKLLDAAVIVPSGVAEIVRLQVHEGYAYLKP